jgi:outer membrane protein assembly factor BamB
MILAQDILARSELMRKAVAVRLVALAALGVWVGGVAAADDWPQFRGPHASGVSDGSGLPEAWDATENISWKTEIPGRGWSSPIAWGDRLFVTSAIQEEGEPEPVKKGLYFGGNRPTSTAVQRWMVYCLDGQTGKILWEQTAGRRAPRYGRHLKNSFASETPVTDGQRLYAYFGNVGLFCYDLRGKPLWSRTWDEVPMRFNWGTAASPVLHGDRLYLVNDNDQQSFLVALDKLTGEELWRTPRDEKSNWSTPFVWENSRRTEIVTPGSQRIRSYDLNGKLLWELGGASSITVPTPCAGGDLLYVSSGYVGDGKRPVFAIRPGASGDISLKNDETSNRSIAWCQKTGAPYNPSPLLYGDYFYVLHDRGFLACYDARSGREIYGKTRLAPETEAFTSSPWAYQGKIFCLSEDGDTFVIQAGPEYKLLRTNRVGELCMATPAILRHSLILRTESHLWRIENR